MGYQLDDMRTLSGIVLLTIMLSACGDSGGGGGITYTGVTTQATISDTNATTLSTTAYQGGRVGSASSTIGIVQDSQNGQISHSRTLVTIQVLEKTFREIDLTPMSSVIVGAVVSVNDTISGDCGGNVAYSISADDQTGDFTGQFTFNNYCSDNDTLSGSASVSGQIDMDTEEITSLNLSINNLTISSGGDSFTIAGNIALNLSSSPITVTMSLLLRDDTGKVYWVKDFSMTFTEQVGFIEINMTGRFYHPDYGYVDLSTPTPLSINSSDDYPSSGVLVLSGSGNTKVRLTADSSTTFHVDADTDGDGDYDDYNSGSLSWSDL